MLTEKQSTALWLSIEHWFENWKDPEHATIEAEDCACCVEFENDACQGCPIAEKVGGTGCVRTPWVDVDAIRNQMGDWPAFLKTQNDDYRVSIEEEYAFLVDVALED